MFRSKLFLGSLLVCVCPVEYLLFNELTRCQGLEWSARKVEVRSGCDRQELSLLLRQHCEVFVNHPKALRVLQLFFFACDGLFFTLEEFFGCLPPGTKVVLVEDDQIPIHRVQPFILRLNVASGISTQQVLEGAKVDHWLLQINLRRVGTSGLREVLPTVEVHVAFEISLPGILDCGLEGHDKDALRSELLRKLVARERLAEAHLGIP